MVWEDFLFDSCISSLSFSTGTHIRDRYGKLNSITNPKENLPSIFWTQIQNTQSVLLTRFPITLAIYSCHL